MNKKYQVFISSTYEDLKVERQKIIDTVLSLSQFPVGMEMFCADDEEQWVTIKETIDCSDFYLLVVGNRYGTVITDGEYAGISYTEREFKYALRLHVPVLAFVIADDAVGYPPETNLEKISKLHAFKQSVKDRRMVKFWHNADDLATQVAVSLGKAINRDNRPGWIRTTEFDIEKSMAEITRLTERVHTLEALNADLKLSNDRRPELKIKCRPDIHEDGEVANDIVVKDDVIKFRVAPVDVSDIKDELIYRDVTGTECKCSKDEVRYFRYLCKNGFSVLFDIVNEGNARATGVKIKWKFSNDLMAISMSELMSLINEDVIRFSEHAYDNWHARFFEPERIDPEGDGTNRTNTQLEDIGNKDVASQDGRFITKDELVTVDEIANLLDPAECEGDTYDGYDIFSAEAEFRIKELQHYDSTFFRGLYILPLAPGKHEIECCIICNEYSEPTKQIIEVEID